MKGKKKWKRTTAERRQTNNKETWRIYNNQFSECINYTYQHNIGMTYISILYTRSPMSPPQDAAPICCHAIQQLKTLNMQKNKTTHRIHNI